MEQNLTLVICLTMAKVKDNWQDFSNFYKVVFCLVPMF